MSFSTVPCEAFCGLPAAYSRSSASSRTTGVSSGVSAMACRIRASAALSCSQRLDSNSPRYRVRITVADSHPPMAMISDSVNPSATAGVTKVSRKLWGVRVSSRPAFLRARGHGL